MEKIFIATKNKFFNVSKTIKKQIELLEKELENQRAETERLKERQQKKFNNFSELVFAKVINTEVVGKTCKQINFDNGQKVRYHSKNCDSFRFWED